MLLWLILALTQQLLPFKCSPVKILGHFFAQLLPLQDKNILIIEVNLQQMGGITTDISQQVVDPI